MDNIYYVYVYCNKKFLYKVKNDYGIKYLPIYVGRGKEDRIQIHNRKSHNRVLRKYIERMKAENNEPYIFKIKEGMNEKDAYKLENEIIKNINVIYSGKGCLFNKYIDGAIYEIYDSKIINEIVEKYEDIVTSNENNMIVVDETYRCYNRQEDDSKKQNSKNRPLIASPEKIPIPIKSKIIEYIMLGFTLQQCSSMFKIPHKNIVSQIDKDIIKKWVV